ncbi:MAG: PglZ domain-containing protein [Chitinophagaceae bacterium]|nr:MAG: PglZ domain-containing protein [Chitinophagaceae bacterium]
MNEIKILWADDEIDLLKPQILFLEQKGYQVQGINNGSDAIEICKEGKVDVVLLDESMPGLSGLETLAEIKKIKPSLPVVMITKNEAEDLMEDAIGNQIADYLIKPVNPNQILLTLKKLIDNKRLVSAKTNMAYQQEFQKIFMKIQDNPNADEWIDIYKQLIYWELELDKTQSDEMQEVLSMQKQEANVEFGKFIIGNYKKWMQSEDSAPMLSHNLFKKHLLPVLSDDMPTYVILIDNLRYDQWKVIQPIVEQYFRQESEIGFYSFLPTATQYSRNAMFAGMTPLEIDRSLPEFWKNDEEEGGKNLYEKELLNNFLKSNLSDTIKWTYQKVTNSQNGKALVDNIQNLSNNKLNVIVYNFVDMLSHARTEMEVLKELAGDEKAYRSITKSWFLYSPLLDALKKIASNPCRVVFTTDHGTIRVKQASKCVGDRNTTTNIRYKTGKNLQFNEKDVLFTRNPHEFQLPKTNVSSSFIFAKEDLFFVYPNNFNHFVKFFKDTFQHGGISLEEMVVPFSVFTNRK